MERGSSREITKSSFRSLNPILIQKALISDLIKNYFPEKIPSTTGKTENNIGTKSIISPLLRDPVDFWRRALKAKWRGVAPEKSPKAHLDRLILY
ncbi:hypothetical protein CDAR_28471 [Caerostris darwini]|uniref:Uncharacterized protein n=1 Tax=Caerostris darwini TaxID=1538125 RepID=A0AAV4Q1W2_9ARAC|nr:hypothetical protein CDAR_28471 [Caerostris darwini]